MGLSTVILSDLLFSFALAERAVCNFNALYQDCHHDFKFPCLTGHLGQPK
jgi:hypothetical protein